MFLFRFLIRDVFFQLSELYTEQKEDFAIPITVYRGTRVSQEEVDMLQRNVGNLISRHQFLSTSMEREVALRYINDAPTESDETYLLEEIFIEPDNCRTVSFASIGHCSSIPGEGEILLSIGSVFRINAVSRGEVSFDIILFAKRRNHLFIGREPMDNQTGIGR